MKALFSLLLLVISSTALAAAPLRVLVPLEATGGAAKIAALLETRGLAVEKANSFPTATQLSQSDVLVLFSAEMKPAQSADREALENFARRGGAFVVLHGGVATGSASWWKPLIGGAWLPETSRTFSSRMMLYVATDQHPIVRGASPFDLDDETLYDLDLDANIRVLASAFTPKVSGVRADRAEAAQAKAKADRANVYDLQPQMWAFENTLPGGKPHRAFVALQGAPATLDHASMQTFLLRGLAWAAGRENLNELCRPEELATLRYPAGGPLEPDATAAQFKLHPDFTATVVAAEPLINKPIAMQWDAAGRLWVAETPEYPNGRRPIIAEPWKETGALDPDNLDRPARDRISILERHRLARASMDEENRLSRRAGAGHRLLPLPRGRDRARAARHRFHPRPRRRAKDRARSTPASPRATRTSSPTISSSRRTAGSTRTWAAAPKSKKPGTGESFGQASAPEFSASSRTAPRSSKSPRKAATVSASTSPATASSSSARPPVAIRSSTWSLPECVLARGKVGTERRRAVA